MKYSDVRVKSTNEIFQGIRAIKSYNWELPFLTKLQNARENELNLLKEGSHYRSFLVAVLGASPSIVAVLTLMTYALLGNRLDPTNVFTSLALFNQLRFPLTFIPMLLSSLAEGKVSLKRINTYLSQDEIQNYVDKVEDESTSTAEMDVNSANANSSAVSVTNGSFSWNSAHSPDMLATMNLSANPIDEPADMNSATGSTPSINNSNNNNCASGILTNVTLQIKPGELVAVIGSTGTGKSTLLYSLLGELNKLSGEVKMKGDIAYVPQTSWIPNDSLRNTILFGKEMNWRNYRKAIRVSGLHKDLELLPNGDLTEIGDKGINLSGGQRQRISIARAVYQNSDIYLLDDPLSALDSQVGHKVFDDCVKNALKGKTRILVTHKLSILSEVDRVILMDTQATDQGTIYRIKDQGTVWQLILRGHDLTQYVKENPNNQEVKEKEEKEILESKTKKTLVEVDINAKIPIQDSKSSSAEVVLPTTSDSATPSIEASSSTSSSALPSTPEGTVAIMNADLSPSSAASSTSAASAVAVEESDSDEPMNTERKIPGKIIEERRESPVSFEVYRRYLLEAKKPFLLVMILLSYLLANSTQVFQQWIVAAWTNDFGYKHHSLGIYLFSISVMALMTGGFTYLRSFLSSSLGASAGKAIHNKMIARMLNAPLSYFGKKILFSMSVRFQTHFSCLLSIETTPIGRLLMRFSKDLDQIDNQLPNSMGTIVASFLQIFTSMAAICAMTPAFGFYMMIIFSLYFMVTNYYRPIARELKRLDSLSRSPIYSHFSETLNGLTVIRSFQRNILYKSQNEAKLDDNLSVYLMIKTLDRWLSFRLEMLGNVIVFISSLLAVFTGSKAGSAGLSLNNALGITGLLNWAVRNAAETESLMNSVEKVYKVIDDTPQEKKTELSHHTQPKDIYFPKDSSLPLIEETTRMEMNSDKKRQAALKQLSREDNESEEDHYYKNEDSVDDSEIMLKRENIDLQQYHQLHELLEEVGDEELPEVHSDEELLSTGWPWKGEIIFSNVTMKYREDYDPVLKKVSLIIKPGEKIGIVGRTGSGKR
jgi:ABC-type multidrug transport system fused ATPase/permease subunit